MLKKFILLTILLYTGILSALNDENKNLPNKIISSFSTYRVSSTASEIFGQNTTHRSPIVEAMGSGKSVEMFCNSNQYNLIFLSREMTNQELRKCKNNDIKNIFKITLGNDTIIIAHSKEAPDFSLTYDDLYHALIAQTVQNGKLVANKNKTWSSINNTLPSFIISFYGPSISSGTRASFINETIKTKCTIDEAIKNIISNSDELEEFCSKIRSDEHYVENAEDHISMIKKMQMDNSIVGIVNYHILNQNKNKIKSIPINNVEPTIENILSGIYTLSIPIVIYYKDDLISQDLRAFIENILSSNSIGKYGYLTKIGIQRKKIINPKQIL